MLVTLDSSKLVLQLTASYQILSNCGFFYGSFLTTSSSFQVFYLRMFSTGSSSYQLLRLTQSTNHVVENL